MEEIRLEAQIREGKSTKGSLRMTRQSGQIPAVVFGGKKPSLAVQIAVGALLKVAKSGGLNAVIRLSHSQGEETVLLKEIQRHVVTCQPIHVDFQRISLSEKIEVKVSVRVVGEAPGVKLHGGVLEHILREVRIRCLPTQIPHEISVDVSHLEIGQGLWVRDLKLPQELEILEDPAHMLVNVVQPMAEAPVAAPAETSQEPEIIAKGKKEEAGGEEPASPPAGKSSSKPASAPSKTQATSEKTGKEKKS